MKKTHPAEAGDNADVKTGMPPAKAEGIHEEELTPAEAGNNC